MRTPAVAGWAALGTLELLVARTYVDRGTWWHWLVHVPVGLGVGLAAAGVLGAATGRRVPATPAALLGQLASIEPDLAFRFLRMPHDRSMDIWLGHLSLHRGPSPVLVSLAVLLLGGWSWSAAAVDRRRTALTLGVLAGLVLLGACLVAHPLPTRLAQIPG